MVVNPICAADRLAIFIDNSNLMRGVLKDPTNSRVNYEILISGLRAGRNLRMVRVYETYRKKEDGTVNTGLETHLRNLGITTCFRDSYNPECRIQKEIDTAMSIDICMLAVKDAFDTAVIVSGDQDFAPAVETLQSLGKVVEIACAGESASHKLKNYGSRFWNLSDMPLVDIVNWEHINETKESE